MKILGIDPGYDRCGWAVLEKTKNSRKNTPELLKFGTIRTQSSDDFETRLQEIGNDFSTLLEMHKPDIVGIEDLFFMKNVSTGIPVAQVRGMLIYIAQSYGARVISPKPVEVKSSFTGNGKATKQEMKKMAEIIFNIDITKALDDGVDAIAVAFVSSHG